MLKGNLFSDRPQNYLSNAGGQDKDKGIIFTSGSFWKRQRRFIHSHLQNLGFGKRSYEQKIVDEVKAFIEVLSETYGAPYDITAVTQASVANVTFSIVCGKRHEYNDKIYQTLLDNAN